MTVINLENWTIERVASDLQPGLENSGTLVA
jgi:hypothetical protein